jgi:hypothetical protein
MFQNVRVEENHGNKVWRKSETNAKPEIGAHLAHNWGTRRKQTLQ